MIMDGRGRGCEEGTVWIMEEVEVRLDSWEILTLISRLFFVISFSYVLLRLTSD